MKIENLLDLVGLLAYVAGQIWILVAKSLAIEPYHDARPCIVVLEWCTVW